MSARPVALRRASFESLTPF